MFCVNLGNLKLGFVCSQVLNFYTRNFLLTSGALLYLTEVSEFPIQSKLVLELCNLLHVACCFMRSISVNREHKVLEWTASLGSFCAGGVLFQYKVDACLVGVCLKLTEKSVYFEF